MLKNKIFYCEICKDRLNTIDEVKNKICSNCKKKEDINYRKKNFNCWACHKTIYDKSEIAQGICHNCKSQINKLI